VTDRMYWCRVTDRMYWCRVTDCMYWCRVTDRMHWCRVTDRILLKPIPQFKTDSSRIINDVIVVVMYLI
jgi:hypothetical protein